MSNTRMIELHGKIKYIHAVHLNKYGAWSITIYPDPKSLEIIRDLQSQGLKNVVKKDDDGYYIQFKREPTKKIGPRTVAFEPPLITNAERRPIDGTTVGWGSDACVILEAYKYKTPNSEARAVAARWDSARIDNLIPFEMGKSDWSDAKKESYEAMDKAGVSEELW